MKILFNLLSSIMVIGVVFLTALNTRTVFDFTVWHRGTNDIIYHTTLVNVMVATFIVGILVGVFWSVAYYLPHQAKLKEYQRKLEKTSVQSDEDSSKVEVLQAKIQTLEKALQDALNKGQGE